ncbi:hypothetical protein FQN57_004937 [Myotisia sp. PD_48]|nr:hypothetical protein FQN57_004937 [Myotisia sp. PD_48]
MDTLRQSCYVVLASSRVIVSGRLMPATLIISTKTGKIEFISKTVLLESELPVDGVAYYKDYSPMVLMPGLVDAHVHLNEPGRTEWEGFYTGTQAAAFGGVTTVVDMPLNSIPPTTTVAGLEAKVKAAAGQCWVDVGFYGGLIPGNVAELKPLLKAGVEEFPAVSSDDIQVAMAELADADMPLMFHAEMLPASFSQNEKGEEEIDTEKKSSKSYATFLSSRPSALETTAIQEIISLAHIAPKLHLHIVHLSSAKAIPLLREARENGINITAETCFHYLTLAAEGISDGDTRYKCCPPIREQGNQDQLWDEVLEHAADGVVKTIVSDHSPCTPNLKMLPNHVPGHIGGDQEDPGNFMEAWGGISSVGLGLPILWTEINHRYNGGVTPSGSLFLEEVAKWCCANTATQVKLGGLKGSLDVGYDADVCVFDDEAEWTIKPSAMLFRNKCSPYEGKAMKGMVRETWLRGQKIFSKEEGFMQKNPQGKIINHYSPE